jgi:hypothetical protein
VHKSRSEDREPEFGAKTKGCHQWGGNAQSLPTKDFPTRSPDFWAPGPLGGKLVAKANKQGRPYRLSH